MWKSIADMDWDEAHAALASVKERRGERFAAAGVDATVDAIELRIANLETQEMSEAREAEREYGIFWGQDGYYFRTDGGSLCGPYDGPAEAVADCRAEAGKGLDIPLSWSAQWPCSNLAGLRVDYKLAANGDLLDLTLYDGGLPLGDDDERVVSLESAELAAAIETYGGEPVGSTGGVEG